MSVHVDSRSSMSSKIQWEYFTHCNGIYTRRRIFNEISNSRFRLVPINSMGGGNVLVKWASCSHASSGNSVINVIESLIPQGESAKF